MTSHDLPQGTLPGAISLLFGHPDPATLYTPELRSAMQRVMDSARAYAGLQYGPEQGTHDLIEFLLEKINHDQGITLQPGNMMLVAGSTHAVDMLARLYGKPGGVVLVEAPTYADALHIFRDHRIELRSVPMDEDGLITRDLAKQLEQIITSGKFPAFLYTIPNFHNPTGSTLSEARRIEIIALAHQYGFLIIEDDVYRDLSFESAVPASFYKLSQGHQVCSIGSFSKTLAPGLRLGWLLASDDIIQSCINCGTTQMGGGANPFTAQIVAEYCLSGSWETHITRMRSIYKMRRDVALSALEQSMPSDVHWTHPEGGFFIWLHLPEHVFAQDMKRQALQEGVLVAAGEGFFVNPVDGAYNLRLAYSCATPAEIEAGIEVLARVIRGLQTGVS